MILVIRSEVAGLAEVGGEGGCKGGGGAGGENQINDE